ncbi:hypothetical protein OV079_09795 [Nannocystis pusilla]|uniref:Lipoprotein n=1 Tax=Nannocystis pusilla TaxID=889268 RepID=A0A9X3EKP3_9BACT|nr:hypothetical protein [Nannocystis pusilla]MCY1005854.1 hypothetical protein [Nannocystis pusilla]
MQRTSPGWKQGWLGVAAAAVLASSSLGALTGCAPGECKDVKPLIGEVRTALDKLDTRSALPGAEKLHEALASTTTPELKVLRVHTQTLVEAVKRAQTAPTSEAGVAERNRHADALGVAVKDWQGQAAVVDAKLCK